METVYHGEGWVVGIFGCEGIVFLFSGLAVHNYYYPLTSSFEGWHTKDSLWVWGSSYDFVNSLLDSDTLKQMQ